LSNSAEKLIIHEPGVSGQLSPYDLSMKGPEWKAAKFYKDPNTDKVYSLAQKIAGANYIIDKLWSPSNSAQLLALLEGRVPVFTPVPSTSGCNVVASAFAKKLADDLGGEVVEGFQFLDALHQVPIKFIPTMYKPYTIRDFYVNNEDELSRLIGDKAVVVVDDVFSTGASAKSFCVALQFSKIQVHTVAGLMGDTRLTPEPSLIEDLRMVLNNCHLTQFIAQDIAVWLSRGQIGILIKSIKKMRFKVEISLLAENLQRVLDYRLNGSDAPNS
jgi:hypothetical protein